MINKTQGLIPEINKVDDDESSASSIDLELDDNEEDEDSTEELDFKIFFM